MSTENKLGGVKILQNRSDKKHESLKGHSFKAENVAPYIADSNGSFIAPKRSWINGDGPAIDKSLENDVIVRSTGSAGFALAIRAKSRGAQLKPYRDVSKSDELSPVRQQQPTNGHESARRFETKHEGEKGIKLETIPDPELEDRDVSQSGNATQSTTVTTEDKLKLEKVFFNPVKLIDMNFKWTDLDLKLPSENTNYLVVGVIGKQGVGKTTIVDTLCAGYQFDASKTNFSAKSKARESRFRSSGISLKIAEDRILYLDCQPVLSASVLDYMSKMDRQPPPDVKYLDNWAEMQSLQLACFMLSVCHVVLVVSEWKLDMDMVEFVRVADVLKPAAPSVTDRNGNTLPPVHHVPNIVFVVNKMGSVRKEHQLHKQNAMFILDTLKTSDLNFTSGINDIQLKAETTFAAEEAVKSAKREEAKLRKVNLCHVPFCRPSTSQCERPNEGADDKMNSLRWSCGPNFLESIRWLKNRLSSLPSSQISVHNNERQWLSYCHKMWDATKKSQMIAEYCQLMT